MEFEGAGEFNSEWRYMALPYHTDSELRVRLWFKSPDFRQWLIGHSKPVGSRSLQEVSDIMRRFINGEINHDEYNELLPEEV